MRIDPQTALLQALISGPGYGLELIERVKNRTEGRIALGNGKVYPALRDLERAGFVESYKVEENLPQRAGRPRIYYKLTGVGYRAAQEEREIGLLLFGADLSLG
jgi:PadR family transcriptional regulator, regulatory protein PadR